MTDVNGEAVYYPSLKQAFSHPDSAPAARQLLLAAGVWFGPQVYRDWPSLVPWAVRDNKAGHGPGQDPEALWRPNGDGFMRSDNSPIGTLKKGLVVDGARAASLKGKKVGKGWGQAHVWHGTATHPLLNSFVPNLVWLPIEIMKLTDHVPVVQAELQRLSWELFRHLPVRPGLESPVEEAWDALPVRRYDADRDTEPTVNRFATTPEWLNGRSTKLLALAGLLRARAAGESTGKVAGVQPRYAEGLADVDRQVCAELLRFLTPLLDVPRLDETAAPPAPVATKAPSGDWIVRVDGVASEPLPKNRAVMAVVAGLVSAGVAPSEIRKLTGPSRWRPVGSAASGEALWADFSTEHGIAPGKRSQWFVDEAVRDGQTLWLLQSNVWGKGAEEQMTALAALAAERVQFEQVGGAV